MTEFRQEPPSGIRTRFRAHIREEVKRVALTQLATGGPQAVSVNAIAKELGVSGPALYRYFAGRDDLLTELAVDAYRDFAAALTEGTADPPVTMQQRLWALAHAYRDWALGQPERYRLMFAAPLPDFDAQSATLVDAAQSAMNVLIATLNADSDADADADLRLPGALTDRLAQWSLDHAGSGGSSSASGSGSSDDADAGVDPAVAFRAVTVWAGLHGLVSLEIGGNFASMGLPENELFDAAINALLR